MKQASQKTEPQARSAAPEAINGKGVGIAAPGYQPVIQAKTLDVAPHGTIWVPDTMALTPDLPSFGGTANIGSNGLAYPAATSMEVLITPAHPMGSEPKALAEPFAALPTKGKYDLLSNANKPKNGSTLYIKGHLLNDNLGGPGTAENLYPITHQANVDHDHKVEEPIKTHVNKEGGAVHYKVTVAAKGEGNTNLFADNPGTIPLHYINADFSCVVTEYKNDQSSRTHQATISSVWGGTDNSGVNNIGLYDTHTMNKADAFDKSKVNIMPRAQVKAAWDMAFIALSLHLANVDGLDLAKWLVKKVKGIGPVGADVLSAGVDFNSYEGNKRGTLTKAYNTLVEYHKAYNSIFLQVAAGYDDTTIPTNTELQELTTVKEELNTLETAISEIDLLTLDFAKLSISKGLIAETKVIEITKPYSTYASLSVSSMSYKLEVYDEFIQLHLFITTPLGETGIRKEDYTSQTLKILRLNNYNPGVVKDNLGTISDVVKFSLEDN